MELATFLVQNWEVIGLLVTNVAALFTKQPKHWRKKDEQTI